MTDVTSNSTATVVTYLDATGAQQQYTLQPGEEIDANGFIQPANITVAQAAANLAAAQAAVTTGNDTVDTSDTSTGDDPAADQSEVVEPVDPSTQPADDSGTVTDPVAPVDDSGGTPAPVEPTDNSGSDTPSDTPAVDPSQAGDGTDTTDPTDSSAPTDTPVDPAPVTPVDPAPVDPSVTPVVSDQGQNLISTLLQDAEHLEHEVVTSIVSFLEKLNPFHKQAIIDHLRDSMKQ